MELFKTKADFEEEFDLTTGSLLGIGSFGKVYKVQSKFDNLL